MNNKEYRTLPMREIRTTAENDIKIIQGHAAVFDEWSETLGGIFPFKEKVARGAFIKSIEGDDIRALLNHDANFVLGRNKAGTLELVEDDKGLLVKIYPPDTQWARDLSKSIERGDISQMSIGFCVTKDEWKSEKDCDTRTLKEVKLFDVSPVTFPAYPQTDVGVRSHEEYRSQIEQDNANTQKAQQEANKRLKQRDKLNKLKFL